MRYHARLQPYSRPGFQEGDGWFSDILKKGVSQGAKWLKSTLQEKGPQAIQDLARMATSPIVNTGSNILDKIISWSGSGLRLAGRYGNGFSVAGRGRSMKSKSRSRSRSSSSRRRKYKKSSGSGRSRSRSRSKSRSRSRSKKRKTTGAGKKTKKRSSSRSSSKQKKKGPKKGGAYSYRQLKPLLNRADF